MHMNPEISEATHLPDQEGNHGASFLMEDKNVIPSSCSNTAPAEKEDIAANDAYGDHAKIDVENIAADKESTGHVVLKNGGKPERQGEKPCSSHARRSGPHHAHTDPSHGDKRDRRSAMRTSTQERLRRANRSLSPKKAGIDTSRGRTKSSSRTSARAEGRGASLSPNSRLGRSDSHKKNQHATTDTSRGRKKSTSPTNTRSTGCGASLSPNNRLGHSDHHHNKQKAVNDAGNDTSRGRKKSSSRTSARTEGRGASLSPNSRLGCSDSHKKNQHTTTDTSRGRQKSSSPASTRSLGSGASLSPNNRLGRSDRHIKNQHTVKDTGKELPRSSSPQRTPKDCGISPSSGHGNSDHHQKKQKAGNNTGRRRCPKSLSPTRTPKGQGSSRRVRSKSPPQKDQFDNTAASGGTQNALSMQSCRGLLESRNDDAGDLAKPELRRFVSDSVYLIQKEKSRPQLQHDASCPRHRKLCPGSYHHDGVDLQRKALQQKLMIEDDLPEDDDDDEEDDGLCEDLSELEDDKCHRHSRPRMALLGAAKATMGVAAIVAKGTASSVSTAAHYTAAVAKGTATSAVHVAAKGTATAASLATKGTHALTGAASLAADALSAKNDGGELLVVDGSSEYSFL